MCPNTFYMKTDEICFPIYCRDGYTFYAEGNYCVDENECTTGNFDCSHIEGDSYCVNTY